MPSNMIGLLENIISMMLYNKTSFASYLKMERSCQRLMQACLTVAYIIATEALKRATRQNFNLSGGFKHRNFNTASINLLRLLDVSLVFSNTDFI